MFRGRVSTDWQVVPPHTPPCDVFNGFDGPNRVLALPGGISSPALAGCPIVGTPIVETATDTVTVTDDVASGLPIRMITHPVIHKIMFVKPTTGRLKGRFQLGSGIVKFSPRPVLPLNVLLNICRLLPAPLKLSTAT